MTERSLQDGREDDHAITTTRTEHLKLWGT